MNIVDELFAVTSALTTAGVRHAVCGGIAVAIHGHVHATIDIDLVIDPSAVDRAVAALQPLEYRYRTVPMTFGETTSAERRVERVMKIEGQDQLSVDLLLDGPAYAFALEGAIEIQLEQGTLVVVSRAKLLEMKRSSGRARDLADVERLENGEDDY